MLGPVSSENEGAGSGTGRVRAFSLVIRACWCWRGGVVSAAWARGLPGWWQYLLQDVRVCLLEVVEGLEVTVLKTLLKFLRWCACAKQNRPNNLLQPSLCKAFQTDSDTEMYLVSSALTFYVDWDFLLGQMSMDVSSVLAALSSHEVLSVTGTKFQVAFPQGCTPGVAGHEPCGSFIHPGQHLYWKVQKFLTTAM